MSATQTVPAVVPVAPVVAVAPVALVAPIAPGHRPSRGPTNAHKNLDFVLEMPENGGPEGKKRTKTPILCSGRLGLAPGNATVAFLQITAHASKMQMPHNQIINF